MVRLFGKTSAAFLVVRGLKTGGSLSCILWLIYFNDLLKNLRELPMVKINISLKVNAGAFADDLITMCTCNNLSEAKRFQLEFIKMCMEWAKKN